ncbi:hypothetical protein DL98DRAFT_572477 [Cadophora sp. DSE1049]|nr:hypothetical protein DL98DRAFT_572477 [Cadophora sp. DSE1049]
MQLSLPLPLLVTITAGWMASSVMAWHCAKTEHTLYRPTCCDSVTAPKRGKFEGTDCYQPFPVLAGNMTVKNEYTCEFQGTKFGFPGCCKDKRRRGRETGTGCLR